MNYIYCPYSFITIGDRTEQCPEEVFMQTINASFKINHVFYKGSKLTIEHVETMDPKLTMRANWLLQPKVNLSPSTGHP